jgi:ribosomal-protein-alanine N-acetyltransferase
MTHGLNFPTAVPELMGRGVLLRPLTERDIAPWYLRATDAEAADLAGDPIPASIAEGTAWLQRHRERFQARAAIRWAIVPQAEQASVGTVGLTVTSHEQPAGELSIVIGRAHWGKGIGTSAALAVVAYGFDTVGLKELHAEVLQRNPPSARLLEKIGFHLSRVVPAQEAADGEACFHYSRRAPNRGAA